LRGVFLKNDSLPLAQNKPSTIVHRPSTKKSFLAVGIEQAIVYRLSTIMTERFISERKAIVPVLINYRELSGLNT
jgi:hypothetical protein